MSLQNQTWSSKWVFILAAIGAAAGLGNLWRFPYMVYENGGGAFLLAYVLILLVLGIPLITMEVGLGQRSQKEVVGTFAEIGGAFGKFVGILMVLMLFALGGYYAAIIGWGFDLLAASPTLAWGDDASTFFYERILKLTDDASIWGGFSIPVVLGMLATYIGVYFSIFKGLKSVGAVVKWTVPLPFILLFGLFLNSLTLDGATTGFAYFLIPDWSQLTNLSLWKDAMTQAAFSIGIGFGMALLYASGNRKREDVTQSATLIVLGDTLVSLVAGFAMFGTLGWMAQSQNLAITEVVTSGITLAFVTFPTALAALPFAANFFAIIFFLSILTLAIDSMFALVEVIVAAARKHLPYFARQANHKTVLMICGIMFLWSLAFAGGNGLYRLDIFDHFLFSHLFFLSVLLQLFLVGWVLPVDRLRYFINEVSDVGFGPWFNWIVKFVAPAVFIFLYVSTLPKELAENYEGYATNDILWWGVFPMLLILGAAWIMSRDDAKS